jgi:hypothetical protein
MNSVTDQYAIGFAADHEKRVIISKATGIISRADVLNYINAKMEAGVLGYAELFDARDIVVDLPIVDLSVIADAMRSSMAGEKPARTAVVTNSAFISGLAKRYGEITSADNQQFKVFTDYDEASKWISGPA